MSVHNSNSKLHRSSWIAKPMLAILVIALFSSLTHSPASAQSFPARKCTGKEWAKIVEQKSWMESSKSHHAYAVDQLRTANKNLSRKGLSFKDFQSWTSKKAKAELEVEKQKWQMDADAAYYKKLFSKCTRF
jgi:hypothetical protein